MIFRVYLKMSTTQLSPEIIERISTSARLLLASDFDGTISNFCNDPAEASLDPIARVALRKLSELPNTVVAVISGRSLIDLTNKFQNIESVRLVGSHGYEFDLNQVIQLSKMEKDLLKKATLIVEAAVRKSSATRMEIKPHGVAFHFRERNLVPTEVIQSIKKELSQLGAGILREGKMVLEFCIVTTNKGQALSRIQEQVSPTISVFIGDDLTDEAAFEQMGPLDISIKVGQGETSAKYRIDSIADAIQFLAQISQRRLDWISKSPSIPIDQHLFISDLRTCGLVDRCGTISWLCTPRIDGTPLFASLVGGAGAGHFTIRGEGIGKQEYLLNSLVGRTTFNNLSITDFFDCGAGRTYQRAGRSDLVRIVRGTGKVEIEFAPKFNFGRVPTRIISFDGGLKIECGQQTHVLLSAGCTWQIQGEGGHDVARSQITLSNQSINFMFLLGTGSIVPPLRSADEMLTDTEKFWEGWLATLKLPKNNSQLVALSALVLRGLFYGPTGAIAAAATTSLPERIGGVRNWDYRYCWPRDACLSASALLSLNATGPAMRLLDWILEVVNYSAEGNFLSPLYTVTGRSVPGEAEISEAFGYLNSRPVRIGNLAAEQLQLDALGPIAELMKKLAQNGISLTSEHHQLADRLVTLVQARWKDKDSGIWEVRGVQRHFVHSKLMCWYTLVCCAEVSNYLGINRPDWIKLADEIRLQIEDLGFDQKLNSYVAAYDLKEADAALLWIILSGFHPPDHPRSLGTLNYIMDNLVHNDSVYRYHFDDALQGQEGEFIICRCWLIEVLAMVGRHAQARAMFEQMLSRIGTIGLLSEQWDQSQNQALGNYPQAYSHLGLINAACALDRFYR